MKDVFSCLCWTISGPIYRCGMSENSQKSTIYQKKGMLFLQKHSAQTFRTKDIKYRKIIYIYLYTFIRKHHKVRFKIEKLSYLTNNFQQYKKYN